MVAFDVPTRRTASTITEKIRPAATKVFRKLSAPSSVAFQNAGHPFFACACFSNSGLTYPNRTTKPANVAKRIMNGGRAEVGRTSQLESDAIPCTAPAFRLPRLEADHNTAGRV